VPETAMAVARTTPCEQSIEDIVDESREKRKERKKLEKSVLCDLLNLREYALVGKRRRRWWFLLFMTSINKNIVA
jgi:hypothetical protein